MDTFLTRRHMDTKWTQSLTIIILIFIIQNFSAFNLNSTVKSVNSGYEALQSLTYYIQDQIVLESTTVLDRERWKCLDLELSRVQTMGGNGYFFISKSSLVSLMSIRKVVIL